MASSWLTLLLKELEKEDQAKPKVGRRKETSKIRAEVNKTEVEKNQLKLRVVF